MAALTPTARQDTVMGNKRVALITLAAVANADTLATGMQSIDWFEATPATSAAVGGTIAGGTLTFTVSAGNPACRLMVVGI